jgi:endoplasmic reticulum-Golgi intermediate compartment protein 3
MAQQKEGCNIEGRVRVNKVTGNIQFSPGRSFVVNRPEVYQLVPYLKDSDHFFGHFIHKLEIYDFDEDTWTRENLPSEVKERLGITRSTLEDVYAHVGVYLLDRRLQC